MPYGSRNTVSLTVLTANVMFEGQFGQNKNDNRADQWALSHCCPSLLTSPMVYYKEQRPGTNDLCGRLLQGALKQFRQFFKVLLLLFLHSLHFRKNILFTSLHLFYGQLLLFRWALLIWSYSDTVLSIKSITTTLRSTQLSLEAQTTESRLVCVCVKTYFIFFLWNK